MKKIITLLSIAVIIFCFIAGNNINAQNKRTYIGLNTGLFVPGNDYLVGGVRTVSYDAGGSPVGLFVTGFGTGGDLNISIHHYFSAVGIRLRSGVTILRQNVDLALAPDGDRLAYDNTLDIVPVELSLVYKIDFENSKVVPYLGTGLGFYYGSMETKIMPENGQRTWNAASAISGGITSYSGIYIPIYFDLLLNVEVGYNFALGNWELEDQDDQTVTKYEKLNTGGISFNIGLAFRF
jgi:outer membrane protein W